MAHVAQEVERVAIDGAERLASGTVGTEPALAEFVQDGLGQDRAGRVGRAEKQDVVDAIRRGRVLRDRRAVRVVSGVPAPVGAWGSVAHQRYKTRGRDVPSLVTSAERRILVACVEIVRRTQAPTGPLPVTDLL